MCDVSPELIQQWVNSESVNGDISCSEIILAVFPLTNLLNNNVSHQGN